VNIMSEISKHVIDLATAKEVPWRPGYQNFPIAGKQQGVTVSATMAILQPGAGAPLHFHETADEVLVVLEGALDLTLGEERMTVPANSAISIPARTPHSFVGAGPGTTRFLAYLPQQGAYIAATYLDGQRPLSDEIK